MRIYREKDYDAMSRRAANIISAEVIRRPDCVLGLATGSTPIPVFRRSTRKVPSFSSRHFFISFPASRFFLYLQQIFNALLGLF
ncbi:hypothetical protein, partial [Alitiscatomonas aceti]|nr:hypothetical protein [Alitiscatomonas aceti]